MLISILPANSFPSCRLRSEQQLRFRRRTACFFPLKVLVPEAPGTDTIGYSPLILDISNISQGYLTAVSDSNGTTKNIQLSADDGVVYSYFVSSGESAVIPFTSGSGTYQVSCYEQVNGSQYAALFAQALEVSLENEFLPFLYPNQYVNFTPTQKPASWLFLFWQRMPRNRKALTPFSSM